MTKVILAFLSGIILMSMFLLSCGGGEDPTPTVRPTPTMRSSETVVERESKPMPTSTHTPVPMNIKTTGNIVDSGKMIVEANGCIGCHSISGEDGIGPTWKGLYNSNRELDSGDEIKVDEDYLRESIVDPNAKIVKGYAPNLMPQTFGEMLSEEEITAVIAYIESVS